jgi:hypothetical protein
MPKANGKLTPAEIARLGGLAGGPIGGRISRRGPAHDPKILLEEPLKGLSAVKQAELLGIHRTTIFTYRRLLREAGYTY